MMIKAYLSSTSSLLNFYKNPLFHWAIVYLLTFNFAHRTIPQPHADVGLPRNLAGAQIVSVPTCSDYFH